jgi:hypothetical protein
MGLTENFGASQSYRLGLKDAIPAEGQNPTRQVPSGAQ